MTRTRRGPLPAWVAGSGVIALSMGVMNVATYAFTLLTARVLGPPEYGALAALMGVLLVLNVVSLGLMATAARRVSTAGGESAAGTALEREVARTSSRAAWGLGAVTLAATPVLTTALRLESWVDAVLLAVSVVPLTAMGAQSGILQGERRWLPLALVFLGMGLGRLVCGGVAVALHPDTTGAMAGVAVGAFLPALIGWWALRHPSRTGAGPAVEPAAPGGSLLREVSHNSHALLAFFTLSSADVIVARSLLDDHQSGLYAGGLILAKAVLFLPQFVVVLVFPSMAAEGARRRVQNRALALVALIGALATLGALALPDLAVRFVGGAQYAELSGRIWAFAAIGTLLALVQMLVYGSVARQHRGAVWVVWACVVVLVAVAALVVDSLDGLLADVALVQASLLVVLLALGARAGDVPAGAALGSPDGVRR